MTIDDHYAHACKCPSDINEHMGRLRDLAASCVSVTEFGVRDVVSTWAFVKAKVAHLHSYDIKRSKNVDTVEKLAPEAGVNFRFHLEDTLTCEIKPTDFLFIDTLHSYAQLKAELARHSKHVAKFIAMHDTITFGNRNERAAGRGPGLRPAIWEFLDNNPEWVLCIEYKNNNGMIVLSRMGF